MVTHEDVLQMARLSKLYIKEEELDGIEVTPIHLFMRPSWLQ